MLRIGIKHVTLPAKEGLRTEEKVIDLSETYSGTLPNAPADTDGHTSVTATRETFKYRYADRSTRDGAIPTMPWRSSSRRV